MHIAKPALVTMIKPTNVDRLVGLADRDKARRPHDCAAHAAKPSQKLRLVKVYRYKDYFGESMLLSDVVSPRLAHAIAHGPVACLTLTREQYEAVLAEAAAQLPRPFLQVYVPARATINSHVRRAHQKFQEQRVIKDRAGDARLLHAAHAMLETARAERRARGKDEGPAATTNPLASPRD